MLESRQALPVPVSILLDAKGHTAALYKGSLTAEQLLADLALLDASPDQQRVTDAIPHLEKTVALAPADTESRLNLASLLLCEGINDRALEHFRTLAEQLPQAAAQAETGQFHQAITTAETALALAADQIELKAQLTQNLHAFKTGYPIRK